MRDARVLLIQPPFSPAFMPSLGLGRIQAVLKAEGVSCDCRYLNLELASRLGPDVYRILGERAHVAGELMYAAEMFPSYISDDGLTKAARLLVPTLWRGLPGLPRISQIVGIVRRFNRSVTREWSRRLPYHVIGLSAHMYLLPALYFASVLKSLFPRVQIVLGGSHCHGEVGEALMHAFTFLDWVVEGEGEQAMLDVVHTVHGGSADVPPLTCRRVREKVVRNGNRRGHVDLSTVPCPDYDDYFRTDGVDRLGAEVTLPVEASRGCWWGRCVFCQDVVLAGRYRRIPDGRVVETMEWLARRHRQLRFLFTDLTHPTGIDGLARAIANSGSDFSFEMFMRPDISPRSLELLARAGLRACLFGIESFSTPLLDGLGKGTTCLQNVLALRESARLELSVHYNLISPVPFEKSSDRRSTRRVMAQLPYVTGRSVCVAQLPMGLCYGSRACQQPSAFGIKGISPARVYEYLFPPACRPAVTTSWDYRPRVRPHCLFRPPRTSASEELRIRFGGDRFCEITGGQERARHTKPRVLRQPWCAILRACMEPRSRGELEANDEALKRLVAWGALLEDHGWYLTLPVWKRLPSNLTF